MKSFTATIIILTFALTMALAFPTFRLTSRAPDVDIHAVRALMPPRPGGSDGGIGSRGVNGTARFVVARNSTLVTLGGRNVTALDMQYYRSG
ncbi:hypothetical protein MN608_09119 [Microdochium nivale]|nr:hypothetical protein MN608_09119 [Microdochium nivale]